MEEQEVVKALEELSSKYEQPAEKLARQYQRLLRVPAIKTHKTPEEAALFCLKVQIEDVKPGRCSQCGTTFDWEDRISIRTPLNEWLNFCTYLCLISYIIERYEGYLDVTDESIQLFKEAIERA